MDITFLGTGTCVHDTINKAQSSILIENGAKILVDCGAGTFLRLNDAGVHVNHINAILLTHNHTDHNADLLPILKARWLEGGDNVDIYGPEGTAEFIHKLLEAYSYLKEKLSFTVYETSDFHVEDFDITSIPTKHSITSRAYVVEHQGKRAVISGDTYPLENLLSIDCDVIIHELSLPFKASTTDHTTPDNLAEPLTSCRAQRLYFIHIYPHTYKVIGEIRDYLNRLTGTEIYIPKDLEKIHV